MARVLLADDDLILRDFLTTHLEAGGHSVLVAHDGEEAIVLSQKGHPDIAVLDMDMPGITGWEAIRRIKSAEDTRSLPVIVLSAHTTAGDKDEAHEAGCDIYLEKPVQAMRLIETLDTLLG